MNINSLLRAYNDVCFSCGTIGDMRLFQGPVAACICCNSCMTAVISVDDEFIKPLKTAGIKAKKVTLEKWSKIKIAEPKAKPRGYHFSKATWWEDYTEYLKTDEWRQRRYAVLTRDGHVCQVCHRNRAVQAHHLTYRNVGREPLEDLVSICVECHDDMHGDRRAIRVHRR